MFHLIVPCILVIGALLGTQDGRNIEIFNSFELQFDLFDDGQIVINMEYYRTKEEQCKLIKTLKPAPKNRGTQQIVSVNYLFGRPLIPYNFLKIIFASNFRDMGNLRPGVFWIDKNVVSGTQKRSAKIFGKEIRPIFFGKWTKMPK